MTIHRASCLDCSWSYEDPDLVEVSDEMERHARKEIGHDVDLERAVATDGGHSSSDTEPKVCEVDGCDHDVSEAFETDPPLGFPVVAGDVEGHFVMCDQHNAAARVLAYSREEHPYCDIGLYQEVVYYARQLAAIYFDPDVDLEEIVSQPKENTERDRSEEVTHRD